MNYEIVILLSLAAFAFALPLPDEEVSKLQKTADEGVALVVDLVKSEPSLITLEEGTNAVAANVTGENQTKPDIETEVGKPTEGNIETTSLAEDDIKEVPKPLPVLAREDTEPAVPPFAGVRAEPKEGVEIAEAKSTASSPGADEVENKSESKPTVEVLTTTSTESSVSGSVEKKDETPSTEEKPKTESTEAKSSSTKPPVDGENKTEDSTTTTETKKSDKSSPKSKPTESGKDKHDHSSEANKSEESAESKESEESDESNKSK